MYINPYNLSGPATQGKFGLVAFKVILGSFGAIAIFPKIRLRKKKKKQTKKTLLLLQNEVERFIKLPLSYRAPHG